METENVGETMTSYLVRMRCSDKYDGTSTRYFPRTSGMYLSEEEIYHQGEDPQKGIIDKVVHRRELSFLIFTRRHRDYCGSPATELID